MSLLISNKGQLPEFKSLLISNKGQLPEFKSGSSVRNAFDLNGCVITIKDGEIWDADIGSKKVGDISTTTTLCGNGFPMLPPCWCISCKEGIFKDKIDKVKLFLKKLKEQGGDLITVNELSFVVKEGYFVYFDGHSCGVNVLICPDKN